jgi:hypothetical protein
VEFRSHAAFACPVVHGVFESAGKPRRAVRVSLPTFKVDALRGGEVWRVYPKPLHGLIRAAAESLEVGVTGGTLLPTGDLVLAGEVKPGKAFDPMAKAAALAPGAEPAVVVSPAAAADRHPVHLAEPVLLDGYTVTKGNLQFDGGPALPVAEHAVAPPCEVTPEAVAGSERLIGLLRFDGGAWQVHPLAAGGGGKKLTVTHTGESAWEAVTAKKKKDTLAVLRERASRLLRKKS